MAMTMLTQLTANPLPEIGQLVIVALSVVALASAVLFCKAAR